MATNVAKNAVTRIANTTVGFMLNFVVVNAAKGADNIKIVKACQNASIVDYSFGSNEKIAILAPKNRAHSSIRTSP